MMSMPILTHVNLGDCTCSSRYRCRYVPLPAAAAAVVAASAATTAAAVAAAAAAAAADAGSS